MTFYQYLRERWQTHIFLLAAFLFAWIVYELDIGLNITPSNASYVGWGWLLLFLAYTVIDYRSLKRRIDQMQDHVRTTPTDDSTERFDFPLDRAYAQATHSLAVELEQYKAEIQSNSVAQLEFLTKWLHDVKVPISAARLIFENSETELPVGVYEKLDHELFAIEEAVQKVFYELKSNSFQEDYKITHTHTKHLIATALKTYAAFFSYKKLDIAIEGDDYKVLTDEKWSEYIISQIISNAVKYTPTGGKITISTTKHAHQTTIAIRNTGEGILPEDIGQVFRKGYTSSAHRHGAKATGYGLYLAKKLSDILGHGLTVESNYGKWALFCLTFTDRETIHHVEDTSN